MFESRAFVSGGLIGAGEFVMQSGARVFVDGGDGERFLVPANRSFRHAFLEEALRQPGIGLHYLREGMPAIDRLAGFLQFADRFIQKSHLAEGNAEIVVGLGIFVRRWPHRIRDRV